MNFSIINKDQQETILGKNPPRLSWGYYYPANATGAVGARMIFERGFLSVLPDRVSVSGISEKGDQIARKNTAKLKVISRLESFLKKQGISTNGQEIIFGEDGNTKLLATPNGSCGYIYMSFWTE